MLELVKKYAKEYEKELISIRKDLHSHPEIGRQEYRTQKLIIGLLNDLGCFEVKKCADTGVLAIIKGKKAVNEKCIGIRADIDALGIEDLKEVEYKSQNKGVCHACGHDVHTTILLGVAKVLAKVQDEFSGYIKLFFQPDEEGDGGADRMINEGAMEEPKVEAMIGLHVSENYNIGEARFCYNTMQASSAEVEIKVKGFSAHAAHPETGVDAILIACQIVNNLQSIVSRNISPTDSVALSLGKISGGTIPNALAESVTIVGTIRTLTLETREKVFNNITRLCKNIAEGYGGSVEVTFSPSYPPLINNKQMVDFTKEVAKDILGEEKVFQNDVPSLGVEDFAYYAMKVPSCFYNLGIKNEEKGITFPLHNNKFDIDENGIYYGVVIQTLTLLRWLNNN